MQPDGGLSLCALSKEGEFNSVTIVLPLRNDNFLLEVCMGAQH